MCAAPRRRRGSNWAAKVDEDGPAESHADDRPDGGVHALRLEGDEPVVSLFPAAKVGSTAKHFARLEEEGRRTGRVAARGEDGELAGRAALLVGREDARRLDRH